MNVISNPLINMRASARVLFRMSLLVLLSATLTACGFHLRGNIPLSEGVKNMYLNAPDGTFKDELVDVLTKSGAQLTESVTGAGVELLVTKALSDRTVGTLDDRGKVDSYNLRLNVTYLLKDAAGEIVRPSTKLTETRQYNFIPTQVIQSESEEAGLLAAMEQAIVLRMIRQLSAVTDDQLTQPATADVK